MLQTNRKTIAGSDANRRYMGAAALDLQGKHDGVDVLKETLRTRREDTCEAHRATPRWIGALNVLDLLGLRETEAIQDVLDLLKDPKLDVNKSVYAVRG